MSARDDFDAITDKETPLSDFHFVQHGSVCVLTPMTDAGKDWTAENIGGDAMRWGASGVVIEPRYAEAILQGISDDGLVVVA
jgi:hypothetical protein